MVDLSVGFNFVFLSGINRGRGREREGGWVGGGGGLKSEIRGNQKHYFHPLVIKKKLGKRKKERKKESATAKRFGDHQGRSRF